MYIKALYCFILIKLHTQKSMKVTQNAISKHSKIKYVVNSTNSNNNNTFDHA